MRGTIVRFASLVLLVVALVGLRLRPRGESVPLALPFERFPSTLGTWEERLEEPIDPDVLRNLQPSDHLGRYYVDAKGRLCLLFVGYWRSQRRGAIIHSPKNCLPGSGWEPLEATRLRVPAAGFGAPLEVNRYVVQKDGHLQVVLYWYQAQGETYASEIAARAGMVRSALSRNRTDGALVRASALVHKDIEETTRMLTEFVAAARPEIDRHLPR